MSLCACMGPMYGEPFCLCQMQQKGLPLNEGARSEAKSTWDKKMDELRQSGMFVFKPTKLLDLHELEKQGIVENVTEILASEPTNVEKLRNKLNEFGGTIHSVFPGTGPTTPEELAGQLLAAITSIENGDFEIVTDKED